MRIDELTWDAWKQATAETRSAWIKEAAACVGGTATDGAIELHGVRLVLVPGGQFELGWNGATTVLDSTRRAGWNTTADFEGGFEAFLRPYLGDTRSVEIPTFLIEPVAVPISDLDIDPYGRDPEAAVRR